MEASGVTDIKLSSLIQEKYIELDLKGDDKETLLGELVSVISKSGKVKSKKACLDALMEREGMGSTAIGNGVAIPHAKIDGLKGPILVFGRSAHGVDFNSLDGETTHIFFMFLAPKEDVGVHLKTLAKISHLIKDKFTVGLFKKAKDKKEILKVMVDTEKRIR